MNDLTPIPEGYMKDAKGHLVPMANVKTEDKLEDELVSKLCLNALDLNETLTSFKGNALSEVAELKAQVAAEYGAKKGGAKGNMKLRTFDGRFEVQVAVSDRLVFGPQLQAAKELIDDCLVRWSEGSNENLHAIVNDAFNVGTEDRIDTTRVLGLRRLDISDPVWKRAMDAISDAVRVDSSKTYIRFYSRDPETGARTAIPLDLAAV